MILDIFTDCAGSIDSYGIGCFFMENEFEKRISYKTNISLISKEFDFDMKIGTTAIGEFYAILKALENIEGDHEKTNIYTDNEEVFFIVNGIFKRKKLLNAIFQKFKILSKGLNVEVCHIKGHVGVYGNEIADKLAHKALRSKCQLCLPIRL